MLEKYVKRVHEVDPSDLPETEEFESIVGSAKADVYSVLAAWDVRNPGVQHAIKKLLMPGNRGGDKSFERD